MKKLFLSLLLLTGCEGGTIELDHTADLQQRETSLCASWDNSFCGSGLPAENELEAIRLLDTDAITLLARIDLACISVLDSAHVASTPADFDHPDVVVTHCRDASSFLATFVESYSAVPATCTPTTLGCPSAPVAATSCTGGSISVVDKTGTHASEARVAEKALNVAVTVKTELDNVSSLTSVLGSHVSTIAQLDPTCTNSAIHETTDATNRISLLVQAATQLSDP